MENDCLHYHSPEHQPNNFPVNNLLELSIETLLGTSYEVRLSPRTTIAFLKAKLQRSEGIPKHHLQPQNCRGFIYSAQHITIVITVNHTTIIRVSLKSYRISAIISRPYIYFLALLVRLLFKVLSIFLFLVL